jgi:2-alkenal reductase
LLLIFAAGATGCGLLPDLTGGDNQGVPPTGAATAASQPTAAVAPVVVTADAAATSVATAAPAESIIEPVVAAQPTPAPTAVTAGAAAVAAGVADLQATLTQLYQQTNPSVVYIVVPPLGTGSGFVYSADGYIVTNNHVVSGGESFEVVFANSERRAAELVGTDVDSDLAVLRVSDLPPGVSQLPLADSNALQVGQLVVAIGNPFGEQGSMSMGIISGLGRSLASQRQSETIGSRYSLPEVIQTDAPINPGNSGGPLLNLAGEVIGVNSAIASFTGTNSGVGFSIPVNVVKRIVPELIRTGRYAYSYMGAGFAEEISLDELPIFGLEQTQGAYVVNVTPGTPADAAGLIPADPQTGRGGDLIVAIDGQPVNDFTDMNAYLVLNTSPGQTVQLTVLRNGAETSLPLTLGERP